MYKIITNGLTNMSDLQNDKNFVEAGSLSTVNGQSLIQQGVDIQVSTSTTLTYKVTYVVNDGQIAGSETGQWGDANIVSNTVNGNDGTIVFDGAPTAVPYEFFHGANNLVSIVLPKTINKIESIAFYDSGSLENVQVLYEGDTMDVASDCLLACPNLNDVIAKKHVLYVKRDFVGEFVIADGTKQIHSGAFQGCSGMTGVNIPNSVNYIGEGAFANCTGVSNFELPNSITWLGRSCFANDTFTSISTPANAGWDSLVFENCANLTEITVNNVEPPTNDAAFAGCSSLTSIKVPAGSVDAYKAADGWSEYADIITAI